MDDTAPPSPTFANGTYCPVDATCPRDLAEAIDYVGQNRSLSPLERRTLLAAAEARTRFTGYSLNLRREVLTATDDRLATLDRAGQRVEQTLSRLPDGGPARALVRLARFCTRKTLKAVEHLVIRGSQHQQAACRERIGRWDDVGLRIDHLEFGKCDPGLRARGIWNRLVAPIPHAPLFMARSAPVPHPQEILHKPSSLS